MAEVEDSHNAQGIKLFGATIITVQEKKSEDEKSEVKGDDDHGSTADNQKRPDKVIPCPRCKSMETKFCYFNNYNVNQPRHFCKGCQRYWTAGGALRNVPVGAGRRKNKPPCRGMIDGLSEGCLFDASGLLQNLDFDGAVVEEWYAAEQGGASVGGFRNLLPAKRRRKISAGQPC